MAAVTTLSRPPIVEAVIDIQAKPRADLDPSQLRQGAAPLSSDLPIVAEHRAFQATFSVDGKQSSTEDLGLSGYFFKSLDQKSIAQFRVDGFSSHVLSSYPGWDRFSATSLAYWDIYRAIAEPEAMTRIGLRYINKLAGPRDGEDIDEYLAAAPKIPDELPQKLAGFFSVVAVVGENARIVANLSQSLRPFPTANSTEILLDIDTFSVPEQALDRTALTALLQELREFKNRVFFSSVHERALEPYK